MMNVSSPLILGASVTCGTRSILRSFWKSPSPSIQDLLFVTFQFSSQVLRHPLIRQGPHLTLKNFQQQVYFCHKHMTFKVDQLPTLWLRSPNKDILLADQTSLSFFHLEIYEIFSADRIRRSNFGWFGLVETVCILEEWSLRDWLRCVWGRGAETFTHFGKLDEFAKLILMIYTMMIFFIKLLSQQWYHNDFRQCW